jgi:cystathionine beta-lyase/cystathionine gamma-synthase
MNIHSRAVHSGDRKRPGQKSVKRQDFTPSTTPIHLSSTYFYPNAETIDKIFGGEDQGYTYCRFDNPTVAALEDQITALEGGQGSIACSSGMSAIHLALHAALLERPKKVLCALQIFGPTIKMLTKLMEPFGVETNLLPDVSDLAHLEKLLLDQRPGALIMETVSNPTLRVGAIDEIAKLCAAVNCALIVDNTFATAVMCRPVELGAHFSVHSLTKYMAGHGDVMGGCVTYDASHETAIRQIVKMYGPILGPLEAYLTMRGLKTMPLRVERQCQNAATVAAWMLEHPRIDKVLWLDNPAHPDRAIIDRLFPPGLRGAIVPFFLKGAQKPDVFAFMDKLKMIVPGTSLGDVHSLMLYPAIASHRDLPPKQRERLGITDAMVRLSCGIEDARDIIADLHQALA